MFHFYGETLRSHKQCHVSKQFVMFYLLEKQQFHANGKTNTVQIFSVSFHSHIEREAFFFLNEKLRVASHESLRN